MADKSKNEQYDIVAQAEDVLKVYIKRYFDLNRRYESKKVKTHPPKNKKFLTVIVTSLIVAVIIASAILIFKV